MRRVRPNVAETRVERYECALLMPQQVRKIAILRTAYALVEDGDSIVTRRPQQIGDLNREVLVDLEPHAAGLGHDQDALSRELSSIGNRRVNALLGERGVALQDLSGAEPSSQVIKDNRHRDPRATDTRLAVANRRVDNHVLTPIHRATALPA